MRILSDKITSDTLLLHIMPLKRRNITMWYENPHKSGVFEA
jgi:hypothetical protein